jgi:hypothetical protein
LPSSVGEVSSIKSCIVLFINAAPVEKEKIMSKPVTRIAFTALIVLVLVAGIYFSVQAATSKASLSGERVFTTAGLMPDVKHVRASSSSGLTTLDYQSDFYQDSGHGCERDNYESPDD